MNSLFLSLFLLTFLPILGVHGWFGRHKQAVAVAGTLMCNGRPSVGTRVKLYDTDMFTLDDKMAEGVTDHYGHFLLLGYAKEWTRIDPKLYVYHNCNHPIHFCNQKLSIKIPKDYITQGKTAKIPFNVGVLNLSGKYSGQSIDCIN